MGSSYRATLEDWLKNLDVKAESVLDIGGAQNPIPNRTRTFDVENYEIADLEQPHEGSKAPDIKIDLNYPMMQSTKLYELIFCLEVFEYIFNPLQAFRNIHYLLDEGGRAYVSFPSFYPLHQPIEDDCLRYMPSGIKKLAEHSGLQIVSMEPRRPETGALLQYFSAERLRAAKGEDHLFMGWIVEFTR